MPQDYHSRPPSARTRLVRAPRSATLDLLDACLGMPSAAAAAAAAAAGWYDKNDYNDGL